MDLAAANQNKEKTCIICEQKKQIGIHLYTSFICSDCEEKMISTSPNDPAYQFYISKLKKVNAAKIHQANLPIGEP